MKKIILLLIFCITTNYAQESASSLRIKSISSGFGIVGGEQNDGGLNFYIDLTTNYKKNLISVSASLGSEFNLFDASRDYKEYGLLYGREMNLNKTFKIEVHSGIAIFKEIYKNGSTNFKEVSETAIGLPVKVKLLFYVSDHFALGLNPNITINSIDTIYSGNLIFLYRF
jgi:hypothetical protein